MWVDTNTPSDGRDAVAKQAANIALAVILYHLHGAPKCEIMVRR